MDTISTKPLHARRHTLTTPTVLALGVVLTGALLTNHASRTDGFGTPQSLPTAEAALTATREGVPSLLEGDSQTFDHAVATAATASRPRTVPGWSSTNGTPSLLEGDHGLFQAAIADEIVRLGLGR